MAEKRRPILADRFMRGNERLTWIRQDVNDLVRVKLRTARRFVFDVDAVRRLGETIRDIPELLFRESQLARAPYPVTWIEISAFPLLWETMSGRPCSDDCDNEIGYLINHDTVYVVEGGTKANPGLAVMLSPVAYQLHTPWAEQDRLKFAARFGTTLNDIEAFMWGSTLNGTELTDDLLFSRDNPFAALRNSHSCFVLPMIHERAEKALKRGVLMSSAGDMRIMIASLLLLNRPSLTTYVRDVPRGRGFIRGKEQTYFSHTVVTIALDPRPTLRLIGTEEGEGVPRRRHEVRGTWCNNADARDYARIAGCIHDWQADPRYVDEDDANDPDHWVCKVCEGRRWWRQEHVRGDATKGFVQKDYSVVARTEHVRGNR
jgi:hypothetical protein